MPQGNTLRALQGSVQAVEEKHNILIHDLSKQLARLTAETKKQESQAAAMGDKAGECSKSSSDAQRVRRLSYQSLSCSFCPHDYVTLIDCPFQLHCAPPCVLAPYLPQTWQVQLDLVLQQLHQLASRSASREDLEEIRAQARHLQEQEVENHITPWGS